MNSVVQTAQQGGKADKRPALPFVLAAPAVFALLVFLVLPVAVLIGESLTGPGGALEPYVKFLSSGYNQRVIWRTLQIAGATTLLALALGLIVASALARIGGTLGQILLFLCVFPLLTSALVRSFAWMVILGRQGLVNTGLQGIGLIDAPLSLLFNPTAMVIVTPPAMVIGLVYLFTPLAILTLKGAIEAIAPQVREAATTLGATPIRLFTQVTLPLLVPSLIVSAVLIFTGSLAAFATARLLGSERHMILPTLLHEKVMVSFDWAAGSVIAAVMLVLSFAAITLFNALGRRANRMVD
ncbi:binding-protein-dependent transport systems inner membrane component [Ketogulonicigenium vulgare Y25]|uniref:ABC transporter permease n=1 Tax=Ketogulonicigenium vulgare TaxID=92945 RepID=UPI0001E66EF3|nr:ABC transporter permease [Ketogulonicigenium vulgare]ADO42469.1 binding-protein-dependent transport systems inner membrane component [Ketogulonicigenium vulgare Y25]